MMIANIDICTTVFILKVPHAIKKSDIFIILMFPKRQR